MTARERKPVKWRWILLEAAAWFLTPLAIWFLCAARPVTLETACRLSRLENCRQIRISLTRSPRRTTQYGTRYWTTETLYQLLTPEDASYEMIIDYVRDLSFRRSFTKKYHKQADGNKALSWHVLIAFYDSADVLDAEGESEHHLGDLSFYRHCADHSCVYYDAWVLPGDPTKSGVSNALYEPLHTILETVTAEKGGWIDYES